MIDAIAQSGKNNNTRKGVSNIRHNEKRKVTSKIINSGVQSLSSLPATFVSLESIILPPMWPFQARQSELSA
jgi:hypothetical protein